MAKTGFTPESRRQPRLRNSALVVLEKRYFRKDSLQDGRAENAGDLFWRVATAVAKAEVTSDLQRLWTERFFDLMVDLRFLPNSPTLMNAGRESGQLSACFVLPILDSLDSVFQTLGDAAKIHQSGGGTGFSFSRLRPAGSSVGDALGVASGPVSFLKIYDLATETIKQGGTRRGANMGVLSVDHPDILKFIDVKQDLKSVTNFNLSVGINSAFVAALKAGDASAQQIFEKLVSGAWNSGDPGLLFLDQMNRFNPTPVLGRFEATNPCGEQPLLPYESCNLGSLNLGKYLNSTGEISWAKLGEDVEWAVRFLDNVIDVNSYPLAATADVTLRNRKIGLGVMGFADLLLGLGIPYSSPEASSLAEKLMGFVEAKAREASSRLAKERGEFVGFEESLWAQLGYPPLRNATLTTVAPTGTISLIAGCSSGIEPIFSSFLVRNALDGEQLREWAPGVEAAMAQRGLSSFNEEDVHRELRGVLETAHDLDPAAHLRIQVAFQRHCDSAVSKTVNMAVDSTKELIRQVFLDAFENGCKGITVYRDQCRPIQVLEVPSEPAPECPRCEWAE